MAIAITLRSGKQIGNTPTTSNQDSDNVSDVEESLLDSNPNFKTEDKAVKMSSFNISHALKLIPEYDGDSKTLHRFIQVCKIQYARATSAEHKAEFLDLIRSKLAGRAYDVILRHNTYSTWEEIERALQNEFSKDRSPQIIQTEMFNLQQGFRENVLEYASRIERLLEELDISTTKNESAVGSNAIRKLNQQMAINNFKRGLRHPLKLILKATRHETLREAIDYAAEEEKLLETERKLNPTTSFRTSTPNTPRKQCQFCKNFGHEANECRKLSYRLNNSSTVMPKFPPKREQINNINRSSNIPEQKICRYCKNLGHDIQHCRKREYNNKQYEQNNASSSQGNGQTPSSSGTGTRAHLLK